jgi:hypothetical protein
LVRFASGAQTLVKAREDWIITCGRKRSHVKAAAQSTSSAEDGASNADRTAVVVKRGQTRERSGLPPIELTEFGHLRQYKRCGTCTDSGNRGELLRLAQRVWFCAITLLMRSSMAQICFWFY